MAQDAGGGDDTGGDDTPPFTNGVSMLSGHADPGYVDGKRGDARFNNPVSCAYKDGKVYVADFDNGKIRAVDAETGQTSTVVSQQGFARPFALVFAPDGTLYVSTDRGPANEQGSMAGTIWRVDIAAKTATPIAPGIGRPRGLAMINGKIAATARWLTRFVRATRTREPTKFVDGRLDRATLDEVAELIGALVPFSADAIGALGHVKQLRGECDRAGNLPEHRRGALGALVGMLEARLQ